MKSKLDQYNNRHIGASSGNKNVHEKGGGTTMSSSTPTTKQCLSITSLSPCIEIKFNSQCDGPVVAMNLYTTVLDQEEH
eukprot:751674-Ditylum_brightwellii.AAC.1